MIILMVIILIIVSLVGVLLSEKTLPRLVWGLFIALNSFNLGGHVMEITQEPYNNRQAVEECQKDLPRSQKCVLIAIPEEIKGE